MMKEGLTMSDEKEKNESADGKEKKELAAENASKESSLSSYRLVVIMLAILGVIVVLLIFMPLLVIKVLKDSEKLTEHSQTLTEYFKWALSVLVGAFGAWIGAGAAYFFGKENLKESSRSTESAMRIQQEFLRRPPLLERIKDMTLTAMNLNFFFDFEKKKSDVMAKLVDFKGYWFVPVGEIKTGILQDIIHAQAFWNPAYADDLTLKQIVSEMDKDVKYKTLHGDSFYVKVSPNDRISDVYNLICQKDAEVVIVVDEKGKASHCLSKTDLRTVLKATDSK
jgi:hypothetical protein